MNLTRRRLIEVQRRLVDAERQLAEGAAVEGSLAERWLRQYLIDVATLIAEVLRRSREDDAVTD